jgi:hypothetical protein
MTVTLTREEVQQVLDALYRFVEYDYQGNPLDGKDVEGHEAIETLRARLSAPEPEPVTDKYLMEVECTKCGAKQDGVLTVTAPPQREWQGLTEHEKALVMRRSVNRQDAVTLTETMLREKNT